MSLGDPEADVGDIWLIDLLRGILCDLPSSQSMKHVHSVPPMEAELCSPPIEPAMSILYQKVSSGASNDEILLKTSDSKLAFDWSLTGNSSSMEACFLKPK